ncbi:MAG: DUF2304 family protein [Nanoarchaeota archaeon]|nr:DUF2304 family protein [Nanoarchaeota archaeon]MBU1320887.1 DUF2304 family protein [Nanoarchaeota archaeon]MBU1597793.1 DUF2304 family protein [Nanoarchaeota archaeon]MBU2441244.1 DUF2304 family protein [Nanoarchaeota archaeon]
MQIIQIIIIIFALFALSRAFLRFKDNKLTKTEFLFWAVLWVAIIIVSFLPSILNPLSQVFGIGRAVDVIIYISIIALFYLMFRLYVKIESMEKNMTGIVRKMAINNEKDNIKKKKNKIQK